MEIGHAYYHPDSQQYPSIRFFSGIGPSNLLAAALTYLSIELDKEHKSFRNFKNSVFEIRMHKKSVSTQLYNFKWRDFEASWHECPGEDMKINQPIDPDTIDHMLDECLMSLDENPNM